MKKTLNYKTADGGNLVVKIETERNYWSITADLYEKGSRSVFACGCLHEDILRCAPELGVFVKLHLSDLNGVPMHAIENGLYYIQLYHKAVLRELKGLKPEKSFYGLEDYDSKKLMEVIERHFRADHNELAKVLAATTRDDVFIIVEELKPRWEKESEVALKLLESFNNESEPDFPDPEIELDYEYVGFDHKNERNKYKVKLRRNRRSLTIDWFAGTLAGEPEVDTVMQCLFLDSSFVEDSDFESWCRELGYDTDSRTAEQLYKKCVKQAEKLHRFLGDDYDVVSRMY